MLKIYLIWAQKIGVKMLKSAKPYRIVCRDGVVPVGRYANMDAMVAVSELVNELQESELYETIVVESYDDVPLVEALEGKKNRTMLYEWHMDAVVLERRAVEHAEYQRKRRELKDKIKALQERVKRLDEEWG